MRYFVTAIETETGYSFEQEVSGNDEYNRLKTELQNEGYSRIQLNERWTDLNEMYASLNESND